MPHNHFDWPGSLRLRLAGIIEAFDDLLQRGGGPLCLTVTPDDEHSTRSRSFRRKLLGVGTTSRRACDADDLSNLDKVRGLGAPVASIGGAGTFDGIFLTGILAVLLASLYARRRPAQAR
jgi:uncharacterized protein DUF1614